MKRMTTLMAAVGLLSTAACASDIAPTDDGEGGEELGLIQHEDEGAGVTDTTVDATDDEQWVYLDLDARAGLTPAEAETSDAWDLAFRRFHVKVNGGVSGSGDVAVARVPDTAFAELDAAPDTGYEADAEDTDADDDSVTDYVISGGPSPWFDYDISDHTLLPKDVVYVVRTGEDTYFKLVFTDYYDEAGTSGVISFRWSEVAPPGTDGGEETPEPTAGFEVDASDPERWVHVSLSNEGVVEVANPAEDDGWDIALSRTMIRTNSGASGAGLGGARIAEVAYEDLAETGTVGFAVDEPLPPPGPPGSGEDIARNPALDQWFDYNPSTHTLSPADRAFAVRTADGSYAKLRVIAWEDGVFRLDTASIDRVVAEQETTIDATDEDSWVYFSFRQGDLVPSESAGPDSMEWDLGLSRTKLRTNSGTSGAGLGGAATANETDLGAITGVADVSVTPDEMIPLPGPPGSGDYSGNPVLAEWFDYNPMTHAVTPADAAFIVGTATGGYVKLRIESFDDGSFTVRWAYAGPGWESF